MELKRLISKNRIFNIGIIILALIIANKVYKRQLKEIESLKTKSDLEAKKNAVLESISKKEKTIAAYKNILARKDASSVINTIGDIAKESGVKIMSISPAGEQRLADYIKMPFNVTVSAANYHAIGNFISKLESYQDVYMVESIDIKSDVQSKGLTVRLIISSIAFTG